MPASVQVSPSTAGIFQVVITTTARGAVVLPGATRGREPLRFDGWGASGFGLALVLLVCVMVVGIGSRRRQPVRVLAAELAGLVMALTMMACSGGGSGAGAADPVAGTPVGTYTVMVTASVAVAGQANVVRTLPITITVQ
jgi:hypothetical protein